MANGKRQTYVWRDVKGNTAATRFYVSSGGTPITQQAAASAIEAAISAATNAAFQSGSGPDTSNARNVVYGMAAQFATVEDKAVYTFQAADGTLHRLKVPAPIIAQFEVDQETIDASSAAASALITAFLANAVTADGTVLSLFAGGIRQRVKLRRKLNIFVKVPELDEPAE